MPEARGRAVASIGTVLALVLPPLGVYLGRGARRAFWTNMVLTMAGYVPGVAHAWYLRTHG